MKRLTVLIVVALIASGGCSAKSDQRYLPIPNNSAVMVLDSYTGRVLLGRPGSGWEEFVPPITSTNVSPFR
jgi:hypothetical protein